MVVPASGAAGRGSWASGRRRSPDQADRGAETGSADRATGMVAPLRGRIHPTEEPFWQAADSGISSPSGFLHQKDRQASAGFLVGLHSLWLVYYKGRSAPVIDSDHKMQVAD